MRFYLDNSDLHKNINDNVPGIIIIGGFAIPQSQNPELICRIYDEKIQLIGNPNIPIKWNIRDLKGHFKKNNQQQIYQNILSRSNEIRERIITTFLSFNPVIFTAIIDSYSNDREHLIRITNKLYSWTFENLLQRFGLYIQNRDDDSHSTVIIDWPSGNNKKPFMNIYQNGWCCAEDYFCKPLVELGFECTPFFADMKYCIGIQLADFIAGSTKAYIQHVRGGNYTFEVEQFSRLLGNFYHDADNNILNYGLTVSPRDSELYSQVENHLETFDY